MPFIAFDLEAMEGVPGAAQCSGVSEDVIGWGLPKLWRYCWRERTDRVSLTVLRGMFGADVTEGLVAFGFIAPDGLAFRVRGADRYLRVRKAQSDAGKATRAKLKLSSSSALAGVEQPTNPALTANSEQRTASNEQRAAVEDQPLHAGPLVFEPPDSPPDAWSAQDFERWFQCRRQAAGLPAERQRPHPRALSTWWSAALGTPGITVEVLKGAVYAFGKDRHWEHATPPFPFRAFMSQWDKYAAAEVARAAAS
jgi:hypothetical protein